MHYSPGDNMKLFRKLIIDGCADIGYNKLARELGFPSTSIHDWATMPNKVPVLRSLERMAEHYKIPLPYNLMEVGAIRTIDEEIMAALLTLSHDQKTEILELIGKYER
jgi:hypothetical protein